MIDSLNHLGNIHQHRHIYYCLILYFNNKKDKSNYYRRFYNLDCNLKKFNDMILKQSKLINSYYPSGQLQELVVISKYLS